MIVDVDIEEVEKFVLSDDFKKYLLSTTTDFGVAAFILQSLLEDIEEVKIKMEEEE